MTERLAVIAAIIRIEQRSWADQTKIPRATGSMQAKETEGPLTNRPTSWSLLTYRMVTSMTAAVATPKIGI